MEFTMEVVASAVASEIVGPIFSRVINNLLSSRGRRARDAYRQRLEWLLLDITSKVEEAEGRHITNLSLLAELQAATDAMHRGRFALEVAYLDDDGADAAAAEEEASTTGKRKLAPLNAAVKRARLILGGGGGATTEKRLGAVVEELEFLTRYMGSFIEMVKEYPRRNNVPRPLTTTLFMDRRVFGRHVETERVVAFLLQPSAPRSTGLSALAVVGDWGVGKTTLLKHACDDERVRGHFTRIEWFDWANVVTTGWTGDGPDYLGRIIGTVEPVMLRPLSEEEYWYYFKAFAFGGTDPQDHQRIAAVGREISRHLGSSFVGARVLGVLLWANFDAQFWRKVLAAVVNHSWPVHYSVLTDLLSIRGWTWIYGCEEIQISPKTKLTQHGWLVRHCLRQV